MIIFLFGNKLRNTFSGLV